MAVAPGLSSDSSGRTNCRAVMNGAQGLPGAAAWLVPVSVPTGAAQPGGLCPLQHLSRTGSPTLAGQSGSDQTTRRRKNHPRVSGQRLLCRVTTTTAVRSWQGETSLPCVEMSKAAGSSMGTTGETAPTQAGCGEKHEEVKCPCPGNTGLSAL